MQADRKSLPIWMRKRAVGHAKRLKTIAALQANLRKSLGRDATDAEVASMLAMSVEKLAKLRGG